MNTLTWIMACIGYFVVGSGLILIIWLLVTGQINNFKENKRQKVSEIEELYRLATNMNQRILSLENSVYTSIGEGEME